MDNSELVSLLKNQISNSDGVTTSQDSKKATALDYYYGDPSIIDAEDGESSIITREVLENVERELGQQLKVFTSGEKVVRFDPVSEEDEEQADQETDYVNYIYNKENDGFKITHDWLKSALIEKNSYVKVYVEDKEEVETQTYSGLSDVALTQVLDQENVEPLEHDEEIIGIDEMGMPVLSHDIKIKITNTQKRIRVENVPNEEIGIARNHNALSLKECSFVYHKPSNVTASDLIEQGFDKKLIESLPAYNEDQNILDIARDYDRNSDTYENIDDSTREIEVYVCWVRMDYNDDGIAELRQITLAGSEILENEECDFIPIATLCPVPMAHKHEGLSYADLIMDIQDVKTVLMQQVLTNLYLTNTPEREVVESECNIDDLLTSKSGSIKRVKQPGMIRDLTVPFTAGQSLPLLDILDNMAADRVGSTKNLDPNVLAQTTGMAFAIADGNDSATSEKLARIFAETGFKELFKMIHELAIKHIDQEKIVRIRNKYIPISPTEWKHRANMSVVVGLGTGNNDKELNTLSLIAEEQKQHLLNGSPLASLKNLFNTYEKIIERSGLKDISPFFTDPDSEEAQRMAQEQANQPQQPDPNMLMIQANKAIEDQKAQLQHAKNQMDAEAKAREADLKERELSLKERELALRGQSEAATIEVKRYEADLRAETQMAIEQMKAGFSFQDSLNSALSEQQQQNDETLTAAINNVLSQITELSMNNTTALQGVTDNLSQQVQTMASQMSRPKQVIYDAEGNPVRVETITE